MDILEKVLGFFFSKTKTRSSSKAEGMFRKLFGGSARQQRQAEKMLAQSGRGGNRQPPGVQGGNSPSPGRRPGDRQGVAFAMQRVTSSNVHSIGYDDSSGILAVRYLAPELSHANGQTKISGKTSAPGPLYHYFDVSPRLWQSFVSASSKGKWVWDNLRVRGTIAGHKYDYRLVSGTVGISGHRQTYIPRLASGTGFVSRNRWQAGRQLSSNIAERAFSTKKTGKQFNRGR